MAETKTTEQRLDALEGSIGKLFKLVNPLDEAHTDLAEKVDSLVTSGDGLAERLNALEGAPARGNKAASAKAEAPSNSHLVGVAKGARFNLDGPVPDKKKKPAAND